MTVNRRRFLAISACFAGAPASARQDTWQGRAFGSQVAIALSGPHSRVAGALAQARQLIARIEGSFSLYDPASELRRLNRAGTLKPSTLFHDLLRIADRSHRQTGGLFDPTVQPLWRALSEGRDPSGLHDLIGWHRLRFDSDRVQLAPGQALTFNGIAQGFATDRVTDLLRDHGFAHCLVNMGEYRGLGGPWHLGIADPAHGLLATRTLENRAIATSSPAATPLGASGHIIHPSQRPRWSTVSVEADTAARADALSTGLVFAKMDTLRRVRRYPDIRRITLIDAAGDLTTL